MSSCPAECGDSLHLTFAPEYSLSCRHDIPQLHKDWQKRRIQVTSVFMSFIKVQRRKQRIFGMHVSIEEVRGSQFPEGKEEFFIFYELARTDSVGTSLVCAREASGLKSFFSQNYKKTPLRQLSWGLNIARSSNRCRTS